MYFGWTDQNACVPGIFAKCVYTEKPAKDLPELETLYVSTSGWSIDRSPCVNGCPKLKTIYFMSGGYGGSCGEQGPDLKKQFNQRACLKKVISPEFQRKHPCRFLIIALPEKANCNPGTGAGDEPEYRNEFYNDLMLEYVRKAVAPAVDPRRIYLTGLGSGGTIANGMALDHPGRFAAVVPVFTVPYVSKADRKSPGNWRCYNRMKYWSEPLKKRAEDFTASAIAAGGDCSFRNVESDLEGDGGWWWDEVWSGDEMWPWLFTKSTARP